jgi:hypothetical protein
MTVPPTTTDPTLLAALVSIYEEIMWLATRPNVTASRARAWYTHVMAESVKLRVRHFSGLVINLGHHDKLKPVSFARSPGAASPLNDALWSWLTAALKESPRLSGIEADRWTNAHVRTAIQRRTGIMYSRTHIWTLMSRHGLPVRSSKLAVHSLPFANLDRSS